MCLGFSIDYYSIFSIWSILNFVCIVTLKANHLISYLITIDSPSSFIMSLICLQKLKANTLCHQCTVCFLLFIPSGYNAFWHYHFFANAMPPSFSTKVYKSAELGIFAIKFM